MFIANKLRNTFCNQKNRKRNNHYRGDVWCARAAYIRKYRSRM